MNTARVIEEHKTNYVISFEDRELIATVRGSFFSDGNFPKVGDYVIFNQLNDNKAVIEEIQPRTSILSRKDVETDSIQIIVTNVDIIFIVMGVDMDFNLSRLERYLLLAKQSSIDPIIVLNKSDIVDDISFYIDQVEKIADNTPIIAISALNDHDMRSLLLYLKPNITAVLLGSSGAGKSTITNRLLDKDIQKVSKVRTTDNRGRHTTTSRQLFVLPSGAFLIDTPGMRELGVIDSTNNAENIIFTKIDELSNQCKFSNCDHIQSTGCAVKQAVESGDISDRQLKNYIKLQNERIQDSIKHYRK